MEAQAMHYSHTARINGQESWNKVRESWKQLLETLSRTPAIAADLLAWLIKVIRYMIHRIALAMQLKSDMPAGDQDGKTTSAALYAKNKSDGQNALISEAGQQEKLIEEIGQASFSGQLKSAEQAAEMASHAIHEQIAELNQILKHSENPKNAADQIALIIKNVENVISTAIAECNQVKSRLQEQLKNISQSYNINDDKDLEAMISALAQNNAPIPAIDQNIHDAINQLKQANESIASHARQMQDMLLALRETPYWQEVLSRADLPEIAKRMMLHIKNDQKSLTKDDKKNSKAVQSGKEIEQDDPGLSQQPTTQKTASSNVIHLSDRLKTEMSPHEDTTTGQRSANAGLRKWAHLVSRQPLAEQEKLVDASEEELEAWDDNEAVKDRDAPAPN